MARARLLPRPVVCLPGLTRTAADFEVLAERLSAAGRRVIALDYRGRGLSAYDPNPANYNVQVELGDALTVLDALDVLPAIFIGTSRGGILTMVLASVRPQAVAAAILNDIGPVIELSGLQRIKSYVGKLPAPENYADAAGLLREVFAASFPHLSDEDWLGFARRAFKQDDGRLVPTYDVKIAETLKDVGPETIVPDLWPQFDALAQVPVMVIRGALSDLLSAATVEAMSARHPDMRVGRSRRPGPRPDAARRTYSRGDRAIRERRLVRLSFSAASMRAAKTKPPAVSRRGFVTSGSDQMIRDRSCAGRGTMPCSQPTWLLVVPPPPDAPSTLLYIMSTLRSRLVTGFHTVREPICHMDQSQLAARRRRRYDRTCSRRVRELAVEAVQRGPQGRSPVVLEASTHAPAGRQVESVRTGQGRIKARRKSRIGNNREALGRRHASTDAAADVVHRTFGVGHLGRERSHERQASAG